MGLQAYIFPVVSLNIAATYTGPIAAKPPAAEIVSLNQNDHHNGSMNQSEEDQDSADQSIKNLELDPENHEDPWGG